MVVVLVQLKVVDIAIACGVRPGHKADSKLYLQTVAPDMGVDIRSPEHSSHDIFGGVGSAKPGVRGGLTSIMWLGQSWR